MPARQNPRGIVRGVSPEVTKKELSGQAVPPRRWKQMGNLLAAYHSTIDQSERQEWPIIYDEAYFKGRLDCFARLDASRYALLSAAVYKSCQIVFPTDAPEPSDISVGGIYGNPSPADFSFSGEAEIAPPTFPGYGNRIIDLASLAVHTPQAQSLESFLDGYTEQRPFLSSYLAFCGFLLLSRFLSLSRKIERFPDRLAETEEFIDSWCAALIQNRLFEFHHPGTDFLNKLEIRMF